MDYDEFLTYLRWRITKAGSQGKLAQQIGVEQGEISTVLCLHKKPGPKMLAALGVRKVVTYVLVAASTIPGCR